MSENLTTATGVSRRPRFLALPSSGLGWASFACLLAFFGIAIIVMGQLGVDTRWVNLACLLSSGAFGVAALVFKHERSWLVWLAVAFTVIVVGGELVEFVVTIF